MCVIPGSERDESTHRQIHQLTHALDREVTPQLLFERGHADKQVGHLRAAIDDLNRVVDHPDTSPELFGRAHYFLGVCHRRAGNLRAALASADIAVCAEPDNGSVLGHRGYIRSMLGMHTEALADYETALSVAPHLGVTYAFRGNGWFWQGRYDLAIADYDSLIDEHADDLLFKVFHDRAAARVMVGDVDGAIDDLDRAEHLRPDDPWYPLDSRPLALRAFAHLLNGDLARCAGDLWASQQLGTNPIAAVTDALLGVRRGNSHALHQLAGAAVRHHDDGPMGGVQMVAELIDDPTAFLPLLSPLIG